jgi:hypothetical protein
MINSYNSKVPSAQIWIDTKGVWHFVGAGVAYHAGTVIHGLNNQNSVGAETDHTINETYPAVQIDSIRKGVAVCAIQEGRNSDFLTFHKIEAPSRKIDPWFDGESNSSKNWNAELNRERGIVQRFIDEIKSGGENPPPDPTEDELSAAEVQVIVGEITALKNLLIEPQYQTGGHTIRDEVQWSAANQVIAELTKRVDDLEIRLLDRTPMSQSLTDEILYQTKLMDPKLDTLIQQTAPKA